MNVSSCPHPVDSKLLHHKVTSAGEIHGSVDKSQPVLWHHCVPRNDFCVYACVHVCVCVCNLVSTCLRLNRLWNQLLYVIWTVWMVRSDLKRNATIHKSLNIMTRTFVHKCYHVVVENRRYQIIAAFAWGRWGECRTHRPRFPLYTAKVCFASGWGQRRKWVRLFAEAEDLLERFGQHT